MDNGTPLYCRVVSCVTTGAGYASGVHGISLALTNHRIISAVTQSVSSIATHGDPYVFTFCSGTANEEIHAVEFDDTYVRALTFGVCSTGRYYNVTLVYL
ncbi:MAG TPA: hypothetical protein VLH56_09475 [Dissulfurispiraceae bacterium]|nr:hypothetical protein [Dissulfurispiraceae bacterium]